MPPPPIATTDGNGDFTLQLEASDDVLVFEKSGWERDLVPVSVLGRPLALRRAPQHRLEKALVVRLDFPDESSRVSDDELRSRLFYRQPNVASVANYLYEVSKGSLELEEGAILHLTDPGHLKPRPDELLSDISHWVLTQMKGLKLGDLDAVNNRTGLPQPDGKPDHLWIITPGGAQTISHDPAQFTPTSFLQALPWNHQLKWPVLIFPEETPLGNIVHETFHAMGEHHVDDLYVSSGDPDTAGIWDLMDVGMYRGWDSYHPQSGPWFSDTAYSPSQPMGWTRAELWYHGCFRETVSTLVLQGSTWTGWLEPLERAPHGLPQRVVVPDPRNRGSFWEFNVRRPWGFDRGRVGGRWGPGYEGLIIARVDPSLLTDDEPQGPVHVLDAHPGSPRPPAPCFPNGRWQLDDAAYNLGRGETARGQDGPLFWQVLTVDQAGRMQVRIGLKGATGAGAKALRR